MTHKTRLDVVVRLKEREEDRALRQLAAAREAARRAAEDAAKAKNAAAPTRRSRDSAASHEIADLAQVRALDELKVAQKKAAAAAQTEVAARDRHHAAWRGAESVRRAADAKREELMSEERRAERLSNDEVASVLFALRAAQRDQT